VEAVCIQETTPVCSRVHLLHQFAIDGSRTEIVARLAARVMARVRVRVMDVQVHTGDWYATLIAEEALAEVHKLPYQGDPPDKDCYRDVEITARQGGECKALNILLVAILLRLGVRAEVGWILQTGMPLNHVASKVWINGQPLWADGSIHGAKLGESPYEAIERTGAYHVVEGQAA